MAQEIYVADGESSIGPVSGRELREMAADGRIDEETLVTLDGGERWIPAGSLKDMKFADQTPPAKSEESTASRMKAGLFGAASAIGGALSDLTTRSKAQPTDADEQSSDGGSQKSFLAQFLNEDQDPKYIASIVPRVQQLLMNGEDILYVAVQKKPIANIAPDCVVLTTKRFLFFKIGLLGQVSFEDRIWRELHDARVEEGILGSTFSIRATGGVTLSIDYLPKTQARQLYRFAQEMEEKSLEERRQRQLEEKRAAAGGVVVGGVPHYAPPAIPTAPAREDPLQVLTKLKQLLDAGLITSQEYDAKKTEILSRM